MGLTDQNAIRRRLAEGQVIPALPLSLEADGRWSEKYQRALLRYYIDAGAGGVAAGVHSTQFEIRDPSHGLFEPVLRLTTEVIDEFGPGVLRIAGICGDTRQAEAEAGLAATLGYDAGLLSLTALAGCDDEAMLAHARAIAEILPVIGFYLQPAVGGKVLPYEFWRAFCELDQVVAIKIAPFDRYATLDVIRAVIDSGREDISLYTGNDDQIVLDLLTPFRYGGQTRFIAGGLLGQWGVWTKRAVEMLEDIKRVREESTLSAEWLTRNAELTDANAAIFDAAHAFRGCIPGILEVLRRQGLCPSARCLDPALTLSPGQAAELDRVQAAYPGLCDDEFVAEGLSRWLDG